MYSLIFYVPKTHLEIVKNALFKKGAGKYNNYDSCCWQVKGEGQFRPLCNSSPFVGQIDKLEKVEEYRVEMICVEQVIKDVIDELKRIHPYEEPAYNVIQLKNI